MKKVENTVISKWWIIVLFTEIGKNRKNKDQVSDLLSLRYKIVKWLFPMGTCMCLIGAQKNTWVWERNSFTSIWNLIL